MKLSSKVHDHLLEPRHECLFAVDIKYAYHTIPFHEDDRPSFLCFHNSQSAYAHAARFLVGWIHHDRT